MTVVAVHGPTQIGSKKLWHHYTPVAFALSVGVLMVGLVAVIAIKAVVEPSTRLYKTLARD